MAGPSFADLMDQALKAKGKPMSIADLVAAVEKQGYKSGNTAQVMRLTVGRGGRFRKSGEDMVELA